MNRSSLFVGILIAGLLTAAAVAGFSVLPVLFGGALGFRLLIAGSAFLYVLYVLGCARAKVGRLALGVISFAVLGGGFILGFSWPTMLCLGVATIWVVRSMFAYSSLLGMLCDAFLCLLSVGWAVAAFGWTGSLAWAVWCFFLAQALHVLIPEKPSVEPPAASVSETDRFARAQRAAEAAIRQLANR